MANPNYVSNPYNFVPINTISAESNSDAKFDCYEPDRNSGYINLNISPETKIFIRGEKEVFYKIGNKYTIPGSTIKGMLSHLIEVISYSKTHIFKPVKKLKTVATINNRMQNFTPRVQHAHDFYELLFGKDAERQGKLYFEDAVCNNIPEKNFELKILKLLGSPKPEESNYYSVKTGNHKSEFFKGNKFYWHRESEWYQNDIIVTIEPDKKKTYNIHQLNPEIIDKILNGASQNTVARVLTKFEGILFKGRIRYENLTDEELGILLMSLDLQQDCFHHIGMAKPYGLGRIKIAIEAINIERLQRYQSVLGDNGNWNLAERKIAHEELKKIKDKAAEYLMNIIAPDTAIKNETAFWQIGRMKDLLDMHRLDPYQAGAPIWTQKTSYPKAQRGPKVLKSVAEIRAEMEKARKEAGRWR